MTIRRVVPNIICGQFDQSLAFYVDFLGFAVALDMGWIVTLVSPANPTAQISLLRESESDQGKHSHAPDSAMSLTIEVADVEAMHAKAVEMGIRVIYPLTTEPWGVRRFHVADPNGVVINLMMHVQ